MPRIISGDLGGRRIRAPEAGTRPTSDRVREALFSRLEHAGAIDGARVLDLYAGSGALGLEAYSRGASGVVLVESARSAVAICRANIADLDAQERVRVVHSTVQRYLDAAAPADRFDLVVADPPYDARDLDAVLGALSARWLAPEGVVVVERSVRADPVEWPAPLQPWDSRRYGQSVLWFAHLPAGSNHT